MLTRSPTMVKIIVSGHNCPPALLVALLDRDGGIGSGSRGGSSSWGGIGSTTG